MPDVVSRAALPSHVDVTLLSLVLVLRWLLVLLVLLGSWTGPSIQQVVFAGGAGLQLDSPTVSWTSNGGIRVLRSISTSTR